MKNVISSGSFLPSKAGLLLLALPVVMSPVLLVPQHAYAQEDPSSVASPAAQHEVWVNDATGNDSYAGDQAHPFKTLQHAIDAAGDAGIVHVSGIYVAQSNSDNVYKLGSSNRAHSVIIKGEPGSQLVIRGNSLELTSSVVLEKLQLSFRTDGTRAGQIYTGGFSFTASSVDTSDNSPYKPALIMGKVDEQAAGIVSQHATINLLGGQSSSFSDIYAYNIGGSPINQTIDLNISGNVRVENGVHGNTNADSTVVNVINASNYVRSFDGGHEGNVLKLTTSANVSELTPANLHNISTLTLDNRAYLSFAEDTQALTLTSVTIAPGATLDLENVSTVDISALSTTTQTAEATALIKMNASSGHTGHIDTVTSSPHFEFKIPYNFAAQAPESYLQVNNGVTKVRDNSSIIGRSGFSVAVSNDWLYLTGAAAADTEAELYPPFISEPGRAIILPYSADPAARPEHFLDSLKDRVVAVKDDVHYTLSTRNSIISKINLNGRDTLDASQAGAQQQLSFTVVYSDGSEAPIDIPVEVGQKPQSNDEPSAPEPQPQPAPGPAPAPSPAPAPAPVPPVPSDPVAPSAPSVSTLAQEYPAVLSNRFGVTLAYNESPHAFPEGFMDQLINAVKVEKMGTLQLPGEKDSIVTSITLTNTLNASLDTTVQTAIMQVRYTDGSHMEVRVPVHVGARDTHKLGWVQDADGTWSYWELGEHALSTRVTDWREIEGSWYYFDSHGIMQTGWQKIGNHWFYLSASGAMQTGWQYINGHWYFLKSWGGMATGWVHDGSHWYYCASSGAMQTGWVKVYNTWYYLNSSGAMQTGWVKDGGKWYYMNASGAMQTGWVKTGGTWYWLNSSGAWA